MNKSKSKHDAEKRSAKGVLYALVLTAAVAVLVFAFAACGTEPGGGAVPVPAAPPAAPAEPGVLVAEPGARIEIAHWEGSPADTAAWNTLFDLFVEAHPEIEFTRTIYPSPTFRDQLATRLAANHWPDVIRYTYPNIGRFKEAGVMLDLTDRVPPGTLDDLVPAFVSAAMHEGRMVAMPHHTDTMALFYNVRMFEESGIRIPEHEHDGWTWDELTDIARTLKADHGLMYAFGGIWENNNGVRFMPFMYANNGRVLSECMTYIVIDSPQNLEVLRLVETWRAEDLLMRTGFTQANQANALFAAEQIAFTFSGSWHCSFMEENMPGNWAVTYMPRSPLGNTGSDLGGNSLWVYRGTPFPDASSIFVNFAGSPEAMRAFCEAGNFIPVRQSLIAEGMNYTYFQEEMDLFLRIVETVDPFFASHITSARFPQLNLIFGQEMDPLTIDASATAEQALQRMHARMTEALAE